MRFEGYSASEQDQRDIREKAADKAIKQIRREAIDPGEFEGIEGYDSAAIQADIRRAEKLDEDFARKMANDRQERELQEVAWVSEAVLSDGIGLYNWLGPSAHYITPARHDDLANRIDGLVELEHEEGRATQLGLAVDATFTTSPSQKITDLIEDIETGRPFVMEYFKSEVVASMVGRLIDLPKTVVAFDQSTIMDLGERWLLKDKEGLANHFAQFQIIDQLIEQCSLFAAIARDSKRTNLRDRYAHAHGALITIREARLAKLQDPGTRDAASRQLIEIVQRL